MPVIDQSIREDRLTFTFPEGSLSSKYDEWSHYRNQFNAAFGGTKAVDIVYASTNTAWLIEVKDYRRHQRTKALDLADEIGFKVRDTLAGLISASTLANDTDERRVAQALLEKRQWRVVLHLEIPPSRSRLWPRAIEPDKVQQKLKTLVRAIDPHPTVVSQSSLKPDMDWVVT
ncbi:MAG TPA: hypothetical protein PKV17_01150 [Aquabacterium sp.]|nr:hypothetical protein [Aquabacterium sp.]HRH27370.1 hypothetical protein [Aquabacterium sp.]